jgi:hypothetical protein
MKMLIIALAVTLAAPVYAGPAKCYFDESRGACSVHVTRDGVRHCGVDVCIGVPKEVADSWPPPNTPEQWAELEGREIAQNTDPEPVLEELFRQGMDEYPQERRVRSGK